MHTDDHIRRAKGIFGYSYGFNSICHYFGNFKYRGKTLEVVQNMPDAKVQMFYMEPEWIIPSTGERLRPPGFKKFHDHQYKIYGTHLESTAIWDHWYDEINKADEIWVGNQFAADAVTSSNVKPPVYVFEHGIDDRWQPVMRGQREKIRFLHVDSGSLRKRADLVEKAFTILFANNPNVELTLKYHEHDASKGYSVTKLFDEENPRPSNIKKVFETLSMDQMVELYHEHDVLVYPSEGEGFGFIPIQALATGMPVISTSKWCSYDRFFKDNIIESTLGPPSYSGYLYGDVVLAEFESILELMRKVYDDIDNQCKFFYNQAPKVHKEYNWQYRCDYMLKSFIKRVGIDMLDPVLDFEDKGYYIKYNGNGKYSSPPTPQGAYKFDKDNRIRYVNKSVYDSLIAQDIFSDPSNDEIMVFRKKLWNP